jgi:hypothetical protein
MLLFTVNYKLKMIKIEGRKVFTQFGEIVTNANLSRLRKREVGSQEVRLWDTHKQEVSIVQFLKLESQLHWPRVVPQQDPLQHIAGLA